jgi:hypothetical protein
MLKNIATPLILAAAYLVLPLFLPWWSVAIPALIFGYFAKSRLAAFSQASTVLVLVWGIWAQMQNMANAGLLASKMGNLLGGLNPLQLVFLTAALGGLIGGLFGLLGHAIKTTLR